MRDMAVVGGCDRACRAEEELTLLASDSQRAVHLSHYKWLGGLVNYDRVLQTSRFEGLDAPKLHLSPFFSDGTCEPFTGVRRS